MEDLNVTLSEGHEGDVKLNEESQPKVDPDEDDKHPKKDVKVETHPCDKCEKVFPKIGQKSLHMRKAHNINTMQYTPAPGNKKVGRPAYRFICDLCKEKKKTENELRSHMAYRHGREKRGLSEMRQGPVQRTVSVKLSPPNKKTKEGIKQKDEIQEMNTKDLNIKSLETKNSNLSQLVEKKQEQLTKQANIIGELRGKIHQLELQTEIMNTEKVNDDEVFNLNQTLEAARRKIFALEKEALHLAEENKRIKVHANKEIDDLEDFITEHEKSVSRRKKNMEITIQEKDDFIRHLTQKLKTNEESSPVTPASERDEHEDRRDGGETEAENIEVNPWQVKRGTTFTCPICNYTRRTESQMRKHMEVHDENDEDSQHLCSLCPFQTNNIDQLNHHVEAKHKGAQAFYCRSCDMTMSTKDELDTHTINKHRSHKQVYDCRSCDMKLNTKDELDNHIINKHKSHKPCRNYANNTCEYERCRFNHIVLEGRQKICFKCGDLLESQKDLRRHMKETHGGIICKKFLENKCSHESYCMFSHMNSPAQSVERRPNTTQSNTQEDIRNKPAQLVARGVNSTQSNTQGDFRIPTAGQSSPAVGALTQQEVQNMGHMMNKMMTQLNMVMSKMGLGPQ